MVRAVDQEQPWVELRMTELATETKNGRMILEIYNHFHVQPGEVLVSNNFLAWAGRHRARIDDVTSGLDFALKEGWVAERPNGSLELTEAGFRQM